MKNVMALTIAFVLIPFAALTYQKSSGKSPAVKSEASSRTIADYNQIEIFTSDIAPRPYVILGAISAETSGINSARKKLQKITAKAGGDAILNFELSAATYVRLAKGIAIRWAKDGEQGLTRISPSTAIPFLIPK